MTHLTAHPSAKSNRKSCSGEVLNTCPVSYTSDSDVENKNPERPGTPTVLRTSGIRLPHDQSPKDLGDLEELLDVDLRSSDAYIDNVTDLLTEHQGIFPNSKLPFLPSRTLLHKLSLYDKSQERWELPDCSRSHQGKAQSEEQLAGFFNQICCDIEGITGKKAIRTWNSSFCSTVLEGSPISRKPDIILVDVDKRSPIAWPSVRAITEVTTQEYETKKIAATVTDKAYIILTTQPDRVFVPILSVWGNFSFRLTVTDRQGQLRSQIFNIGDPWRIHDSLTFLRLIIGLCFADKPAVGYDPTMRTDDKNKVEFISCDDKEFKVIKVLFETQSLVGRATRVWEVQREGKRYILKDAWVEVSRPVPEYTSLAQLKGMQGVPELFCGADVCVNGVMLSTGLIRHGLWGDKNRARVRRRTVSSTVGSHIASFRSKRELISAFKDITMTLWELSDKKDLVHRDVSYNNILLHESDDNNPQALRGGLLIDFEYAASRSRSRALAPGSRTGTAPFMAIELLMKRTKIRHAPHHDLESLFFVLIYLCTNLNGPGTVRSKADLLEHSTIPLSTWFKASSSLHQIGINKAGAFCAFEENILRCFSPYFEDLKPCILKIFKAMYPTSGSYASNVSHDTIIQIFTETLDTLPHEAALPNTFSPLLVDSPPEMRKRSLGIHDNGYGVRKQKKQKSTSGDLGVGSSSEPLNIQWAVVSGDIASTSSGGRGRRGHARTSRGSRGVGGSHKSVSRSS